MSKLPLWGTLIREALFRRVTDHSLSPTGSERGREAKLCVRCSPSRLATLGRNLVKCFARFRPFSPTFGAAFEQMQLQARVWD